MTKTSSPTRTETSPKPAPPSVPPPDPAETHRLALQIKEELVGRDPMDPRGEKQGFIWRIRAMEKQAIEMEARIVDLEARITALEGAPSVVAGRSPGAWELLLRWAVALAIVLGAGYAAWTSAGGA